MPTHPLSVLQKASRADVRSSPYPHIVLKDALPTELCDALVSSYPPLSVLGIDPSRNNYRWSYSASNVAGNGAIGELWRDFVAYHASKAFFDEIAELFHQDITRLYPERFPSIDALAAMKPGIRRTDDFDDADILLDAQISGNTPVANASSVRTTHVDSGDKLFSGLFYLRSDDDNSVGGDLTLSKFKPRYSTPSQKLKCFDGVYVDDSYLDVTETVRYSKNTLVLFINSLDSLHGVTVRRPTPHPRLFLNLVGVVKEPLYANPTRAGTITRMMRKLGDLVDTKQRA
jgi:hypothetical protein